MDKREKVIKGLECCMNDGSECYEPSSGKCPYYKDDVSASTSACTDDLFYDIYALLKAQEPVEPVFHANITLESSVWRCGACNVALLFREQNYCHSCGRKVKWDD